MTLKEKAQLLFADTDLQRATNGQEKLLTPEEEAEVMRDCREKREMDKLNYLIVLHNLTTELLLGTLATFTELQLRESSINALVLLWSAKHQQDRWMDGLFLLFTGRLDGQLFKELEELREKYSIEKGIELFEDKKDHNERLEPNRQLQSAFSTAFKAYQDLRQFLYMIECVERLGDMNFVGSSDSDILVAARAEMSRFENFEDFMQVIEIFRTSSPDELFFSDSLFKEMVLNPKSFFNFSEEEKTRIEAQVQRMIKNRR